MACGCGLKTGHTGNLRHRVMGPRRFAISSCWINCSAISIALGAALAALSLTARPSPALAQACECGCSQPSVGYLGPDGACRCPCQVLPSPGLTPETLSGPPRPPKAGGGDDVHWQFDMDDDDDWPLFGLW